jgi:cell division protein FtsX
MFVTLCVIGSLLLTSAVLNSTLNELRDKVDLNVYFVPKTSESDILNIKKNLENLAEVERVTYVSQEQALANFLNSF